MSRIDVIKENIQFEQLFKESHTTSMLNEEYLIPDTHPDVEEILMVDAKPTILSKDIAGDKISVEGKIEYNVLYLAREESLVVCAVNYSKKFSNLLELDGGEHKLVCEVDCGIEHIEANIINERKVSIDGVLDLTWEIYERKDIELIKDIETDDKIEMLKKAETINKTNLDNRVEILGKSSLRVTMDKPQISKILKSNVSIVKKEVGLGTDKVNCGCYCKVDVIYLGIEGKEVYQLSETIYLSKELQAEGINNEMDINSCFKVIAKDVTTEEDDLGESRIVNVEFKVECKVKAFSKENIDVIVDAYSPKFPVSIEKGQCEIGMIHGIYDNEIAVKDNIYIKEEDKKPEGIITCTGNVVVTEKMIVNDRVSVEGYLKVCVVYKTNETDKYLGKVYGDIPFNTVLETIGTNQSMKSIAKAMLEDLDVSIEANTISVKANIALNVKVLFEVKKDLVQDVKEIEGENLKKHASITIYVIGDGDDLWNLAKKYNTTMEQIKVMNDLEDDSELICGEKLLIPGRMDY